MNNLSYTIGVPIWGGITGTLANQTDLQDALDVASGGSTPYTAKSADYTLLTTDAQIECTANSFTITLPTAIGAVGKVYSIKNTGTGEISIDGTGIETIDDELIQTISQWSNIKILSNGANWIII